MEQDNAEPIPAADLSSWEVARFVFDIQYKQLERSGTTAYSVLTAGALAAALASPVLVLTVRPTNDVLTGFFAILLVSYLVALGFGIRYALKVLFTGAGHQPPPGSLTHYSQIVELGVGGLKNWVIRPSEEHRVERLLADTVVVANVVRIKAMNLAHAIRWIGSSFILLGSLVVLRLCIVLTTR